MTCKVMIYQLRYATQQIVWYSHLILYIYSDKNKREGGISSEVYLRVQIVKKCLHLIAS